MSQSYWKSMASPTAPPGSPELLNSPKVNAPEQSGGWVHQMILTRTPPHSPPNSASASDIGADYDHHPRPPIRSATILHTPPRFTPERTATPSPPPLPPRKRALSPHPDSRSAKRLKTPPTSTTAWSEDDAPHFDDDEATQCGDDHYQGGLTQDYNDSLRARQPIIDLTGTTGWLSGILSTTDPASMRRELRARGPRYSVYVADNFTEDEIREQLEQLLKTARAYYLPADPKEPQRVVHPEEGASSLHILETFFDKYVNSAKDEDPLFDEEEEDVLDKFIGWLREMPMPPQVGRFGSLYEFRRHLKEMANTPFPKQIHVIVETGGGAQLSVPLRFSQIGEAAAEIRDLLRDIAGFF
ncbi:uncharacterized protein C8A04DRAFT_27407 [Dichotomopilus funicola]|uniref:Uncharacterized protein n=1 Tax=Dichotomopilus funicola TaxID=1934379 RepID=A0AAN6ZP67_9PEZI|nr:hypothetical protein C8A04DRAFT_27407 [Dichotomopilus funicola]